MFGKQASGTTSTIRISPKPDIRIRNARIISRRSDCQLARISEDFGRNSARQHCLAGAASGCRLDLRYIDVQLQAVELGLISLSPAARVGSAFASRAWTLRIAAKARQTRRNFKSCPLGIAMHELLTLSSLLAFVALSALEIVLGVDNLVFIAILTGRLPPEKRAMGRQLGLALAAAGRIIFLFAASWVMTLDEVQAPHDRRMGSFGPRSDPDRGRPVLVGQGDLGDSQQSRRRVARSDSRERSTKAASPM